MFRDPRFGKTRGFPRIRRSKVHALGTKYLPLFSSATRENIRRDDVPPGSSQNRIDPSSTTLKTLSSVLLRSQSAQGGTPAGMQTCFAAGFYSSRYACPESSFAYPYPISRPLNALQFTCVLVSVYEFPAEGLTKLCELRGNVNADV